MKIFMQTTENIADQMATIRWSNGSDVCVCECVNVHVVFIRFAR